MESPFEQYWKEQLFRVVGTGCSEIHETGDICIPVMSIDAAIDLIEGL